MQKTSVFNENHRRAPGADGSYGPWASNVPRNSFSDETGATSSAARDVLRLQRAAFRVALGNFNAESEVAAPGLSNLGAPQGSSLIWVPPQDLSLIRAPCWGVSFGCPGSIFADLGTTPQPSLIWMPCWGLC